MKTITTALVLFMTISAAQAQNLSFGPTAGFGHTWLAAKNTTYDNKFFPGFNAGVKLVYSVVPNWGLSADVKFSGEGGKIAGDVAGSPVETSYRAHYIRVPVQAIYFFGKLGDAVRPKVSLGPSVGFLVGGDTKYEVNGTQTNSAKTSDIFDGFDAGINGAVGANFRLGGGKWLNTDVTYYHGFNNIIDGSGPAIRNRNLGINIGVTFPIGTAK